MEKVKVSKEKRGIGMVKIENYSKFKNARMVRISGNFMGGGFGMSQNKIKAVLSLSNELKEFADGKFDKEIDSLKEDEILTDIVKV